MSIYEIEKLSLNQIPFTVKSFFIVNNVQVDRKHFRPKELNNLKGDSTKLKTELNMKPKYTFEPMLVEIIKHWLVYYDDENTVKHV